MDEELKQQPALSRRNFLRVGADKIKGHKWVEDVGIPVSAGLIVGEALVGVGNAIWIVASNIGGAG